MGSLWNYYGITRYYYGNTMDSSSPRTHAQAFVQLWDAWFLLSIASMFSRPKPPRSAPPEHLTEHNKRQRTYRHEMLAAEGDTTSEDEVQKSKGSSSSSGKGEGKKGSFIRLCLDKLAEKERLQECCMCGIGEDEANLVLLTTDGMAREEPRIVLDEGRCAGKWAYCDDCHNIPSVMFALRQGLLDTSDVRKSMKFLLAKAQLQSRKRDTADDDAGW